MYLDDEQQAASSKMPQLEIERELESELPAHELGADTTLRSEAGIHEELPSDGAVRILSDIGPIEEDQPLSPVPHDSFDQTTMPLLGPTDSGPIAQGTQHAVHRLPMLLSLRVDPVQ